MSASTISSWRRTCAASASAGASSTSLMAWGREQGGAHAPISRSARRTRSRARSTVRSASTTAYRYTHRVMPDAAAVPAKRGDERAGDDQPAGERERERRLGIAGRDQDQGREHRRRIGGDAEEADVAALHADVPDIEGRARPGRGRAPAARAIAWRRRPDRRLEGEMADEAESATWRGRSPRPHRSAPCRSGATAPNSPPTRRPQSERADIARRVSARASSRRARRSARRRRQSPSSGAGEMRRAADARPAAARRTARSAAARDN